MTGRTGEKAKQEKKKKERKKESIDLHLPCGYITCREASLSGLVAHIIYLAHLSLLCLILFFTAPMLPASFST